MWIFSNFMFIKTHLSSLSSHHLTNATLHFTFEHEILFTNPVFLSSAGLQPFTNILINSETSWCVCVRLTNGIWKLQRWGRRTRNQWWSTSDCIPLESGEKKNKHQTCLFRDKVETQILFLLLIIKSTVYGNAQSYVSEGNDFPTPTSPVENTSVQNDLPSHSKPQPSENSRTSRLKSLNIQPYIMTRGGWVVLFPTRRLAPVIKHKIYDAEIQLFRWYGVNVLTRVLFISSRTSFFR